MGRKGQRATLLSIAIAGVLVVALLIAGTVLRMNTRDVGFVEAFASFVSDTFNF